MLAINEDRMKVTSVRFARWLDFWPPNQRAGYYRHFSVTHWRMSYRNVVYHNYENTGADKRTSAWQHTFNGRQRFLIGIRYCWAALNGCQRKNPPIICALASAQNRITERQAVAKNTNRFVTYITYLTYFIFCHFCQTRNVKFLINQVSFRSALAFFLHSISEPFPCVSLLLFFCFDFFLLLLIASYSYSTWAHIFTYIFYYISGIVWKRVDVCTRCSCSRCALVKKEKCLPFPHRSLRTT